MAEPTMEATNEYLKKADLDAAVERIMRDFTSHIDQAIQKALEKNDAKLEERIAATKGEIRGELNAKLDLHITQEREQRQADDEALRVQIKGVGEETRTKLGEFNSFVDEAKRSVEKLNHDIRTWSNSLDANQKLYDENRRNIDKQEESLDKLKDDVGTLEETQVATSSKLKSIHYAIYGGNGDGPKSLFALIEDMGQQVNKRFDEVDKRFTAQETLSSIAFELTRNVATRQDQYEKDLQARNERWSKRRELALEAGKKLVTTPKGLAVLGLMLASIVAVFRPEALQTFIQFINQLLSATP